MIREFKINFIKKKTYSKLRIFSFKYQFQFGQKLNLVKSFTRYWIQKFYKWRLKVFLKRSRQKRYRYLLVRQGLTYYKYLISRKNKSKFKKNIYNLKFLNCLILKKNELIVLKNKKKTQLNLLVLNLKKKQYYGQKAFKFKKYKNLIKLKKKKKKLKRLKGKISLANLWLPFFYKKNIKKLFKTVNKKVILSLKKFLSSWKVVNKQKNFLFYFFYVYYIFKVIFNKIKNLYYLKLFSINKVLKVCLFYKKFIFMLYILKFYKVLIKKYLFILENFRKKNLFCFLTKMFTKPFLLTENKLKKIKKNIVFSEKTIFFLIFFNLFSVNKKGLVNIFVKKFKLNLLSNNLLFNLKTKVLTKKFNLNVLSNNIIIEKLKFKSTDVNFLTYFYFWLFLKLLFNNILYKKLFRPYNTWLFFFNYSLNYYILNKLYVIFFNYFFIIICHKFKQLIIKLKLKGFQLGYDFIKFKDNSRYHLGIRPHTFVTTFNRRIKKGFQLLKF